MSTGVRFISGKPGGGKSLYATMRIIECLVETRKRIITNVPLNLPRLREYLIEKYGEDFGVLARVRLLEPEETANFWRYYGQGEILPDEPRHIIRLASGKELKHLSYRPRFEAMIAARSESEGLPTIDIGPGQDEKIAAQLWSMLSAKWDGGILYAIDEAHEFFNARQWAETGVDALHYLSQHRKLGDEVLFITQHVRNVDTQLRRVAQDFTYVKNLRKTKLPVLFGFIKAPPLFVTATYSQEKTGAVGGEEPTLRTFTLDVKGIASCYETAAGVGIAGNAADKSEKHKGLPWWTLPGAAIALLVFILMSYYGVRSYAVGVVEEKRVKNHLPVRAQTNAPAAESWREKFAPAKAQREEEKEKPVPVYWQSTVQIPGGEVWVVLSDNRVLKSSLHKLRFVDPLTVEYNGERFQRN